MAIQWPGGLNAELSLAPGGLFSFSGTLSVGLWASIGGGSDGNSHLWSLAPSPGDSGFNDNGGSRYAEVRGDGTIRANWKDDRDSVGLILTNDYKHNNNVPAWSAFVFKFWESNDDHYIEVYSRVDSDLVIRYAINSVFNGPNFGNLSGKKLAIGKNVRASSAFAGHIGEFAIWSDLLSETDATDFLHGKRADRIRPDALNDYWPLIDNLDNRVAGRPALSNPDNLSFDLHSPFIRL